MGGVLAVVVGAVAVVPPRLGNAAAARGSWQLLPKVTAAKINDVSGKFFLADPRIRGGGEYLCVHHNKKIILVMEK